MKKFTLVMLVLMSVAPANAGVKQDFIKAVENQCKKSKEEAKKLATPGRAGNVIKFKTCSSATITIGDCTLKCKDASSSIGG